jgi:thermitase
VRKTLASGRLPDGAREALWAFPADDSLRLASWRCTIRVDAERAQEPDEVTTALRAKGLRVLRRYAWMGDGWSVAIPRDQDPREFAADLVEKHRDLVVAAHPEWLSAIEPRYQPRGPAYHYQWQWRNRGQSGGLSGSDVDAEKAWATTRGGGTRIAVVDEGFEVDHPDLAGAPLPVSGHFPAILNAPFLPGVANVSQSDDYHGTCCAAMAAGRPRRRRGLSGMAPRARLMLLSLGAVSSPELIGRAFTYAADPRTETPGVPWEKGADVISCSVAPDFKVITADEVAELKKAILFAEEKGRARRGTVLAWAVSNSTGGLPIDVVAAQPSVLAVGATNYMDQYSGHAKGPELDLVAPGLDVYMSMPSSGVEDWGGDSGTSFATPIVAGAAALALSVNHTLSAFRVRGVLLRACDKVGPDPYVFRRNDTYGYGRLNAFRAVQLAAYPPA